MPPRTNPTERQLRLGAELRKLRERAGVQPPEAAALLGLDRSRISHIEAARLGIRPERVQLLAESYGCTDATFVAALVERAQERSRGWWSSYRGRLKQSTLDLAELEFHASYIWTFETLFIPGLLQTEGYARSIFDGVDYPLSAGELEARLSFRLQRQQILVGENAPEYHAIIHEAALRVGVGGPAVMRQQLLRLIEMGELPNVTIQVIPFEGSIHPALNGTYVFLGDEVSELSTVFVEHPVSSLFIRDSESIDRYKNLHAGLARRGLPAVEKMSSGVNSEKSTVGLLQHILYTL
ncbi:helix-turn-helix domain-containing protein [Allostreptomyces psammosilenae]|uniref:Transcriptional regulator with XRE-family HTH domain n=1 Tax=Allostreptomyces psammosilenae TaxID=1892865 RepID=A0A852ZY94_9ACTN|nr:helix-turn-helix transcriptional regulator [Allostreptomyces psammosilenae]NYI05694.1 transcriptional regulator with XRE-family HTH domain [Allostreptomyces psammosilenae]